MDVVFLTRGSALRLYYGPFLSMAVAPADLSQFVTLTATSRPYYAAVGDLNGDSRPDIIAGMHYGADPARRKTCIYYQNRPIGFTQNAGPSATIEDVCGAMIVADVNQDGRDDLIVAEGANIRLFLQKKAKPFAACVEEADQTIAAGSGGGIKVADINGDGFPDIVACDGRAVKVFINSARIIK